MRGASRIGIGRTLGFFLWSRRMKEPNRLRQAGSFAKRRSSGLKPIQATGHAKRQDHFWR